MSSFLRKLGAFFYDSLIIIALLMGVTGACMGIKGQAIPAHSTWYQWLLLATIFLYYAIFLLCKGQTIGMRAWSIYLRQKKNF